MSRDGLLEYCRKLYEEHGAKSLSFGELSIHKSLYYNLYRTGLNQKTLLSLLDIKEEYKDSTAFWTWERVLQRLAQ
jgi:hypothetical protein